MGDNINPVTVASNEASENGGGVYVTGVLTSANMESVYLTDNTAGNDGGGVALFDAASLLIERSQKACWDESHCNFLTNNKSGSSIGLGGLVYNNNSTVNIYQSELAFNRADFGTVLYGAGADSVTTFIGDVIRDNGGIRFGDFPHDDTFIFRVIDGAQVDVYHSTIADNAADGAIFSIALDAGGTSQIVNSIVHDVSTGDVIENFFGAPVDFQNCILHEKVSLGTPGIPNSDSDLVVIDPLFVNRVGNNYHIHPLNSPAIDFAGQNRSLLEDIDFELRGINNPDMNDLFGPYDIGADEASNDEIIFKDGFE